jgi:hypothetical protein
MSKKDELQKELRALEHERTGHTKGVVYHQGEVNGIDKKISALEASIAEEAKPKMVKYPVEPDGAGYLRFNMGQREPELSVAPTFENFIGFKSGDMLFGRLYKHKNADSISSHIRIEHLEYYDVLPIDGVLFKENPNG